MSVEIHVGDARTILGTLPSESVQCVVTSPPYWGLRDYQCEGQLGLEKSPAEYVARIVEVFREVRRVLRGDGTLWLNLGDSYAGSWGAQSRDNGSDENSTIQGSSMLSARQIKAHPRGPHTGSLKNTPGLKAKDLVGIPWRCAFALQADGWWLRSDIIWKKPNPMPESVTDRPTKQHEYIFLLTKSERYFYDAAAIAEPASGWHDSVPGREDGPGQDRRSAKPREALTAGKWSKEDPQSSGRRIVERVKEARANGADHDSPFGATRNKRTVWTVATRSFGEDHFATFPPDLIRPCILAGTSARGACQQCGTPWTRVVEQGAPDLDHQRACGGDVDGEYHGQATKDFAGAKAQNASEVKARILAGMRTRITVDWKANCDCGASVVPCTVLDPFAGSGTTLMVAQERGRGAIGIELNPKYAAMCHERTSVTPGLAL